MQKTSIITLFIFLFSVTGCFKPDLDFENNSPSSLTRSESTRKYYYSGGEKTYIEEIPGKFVLRFDQKQFSEAEQSLTKNAKIRLADMKTDEFNHTIIFETEEKFDSKSLVGSLKETAGVKSVYPVYKLTDFISPIMYFTDEIGMKFKEDVTQEKIDEMHRQYGVEIVEVTDLWQIVSVPVDMDVFEIANAYQESGLMEYSQPNFIVKREFHQSLPADPYFANQYYLRNTGQTLPNGPAYTCTRGADINVVNAWSITKGSSDIIVAVLDDGVVSNHPDIPNTRQIRLNGSNFASGNVNDPSPSGNDAHGTACAGIIAASHNNQGIAGIAPYCKIMPIRLTFNAQPNIDAAAIKFAADNGADVISCSWGYSSINPNYSDLIVDAIKYATTMGRNGKGCVVVFSAGNKAHPTDDPNGYITFPANVTIPGVLTVGASDRNDQRANYSPISDINSPHNQIIDVVAPSQKDRYGVLGETRDVWTTDIPGPAGYNPVNETDLGNILRVGSHLPYSGTNYQAYTAYFGGTSASCPQVAGVAALILSVNPNLTQQAVYNRIVSTARKAGDYTYQTTSGMPNGTWNARMGHGVLNAYAALAGVCVSDFSGQTVTADKTVRGCSDLYVQNVTVNSPAKLTLIGASSVTVATSFTVNAGASLEIANR